MECFGNGFVVVFDDVNMECVVKVVVDFVFYCVG